MSKKRNIVEWAMHYRQIVIVVVCSLIAFGIYSLPNMRKNEFPDFTIRQGIVVAVAPGNTAQEMEEQVTKRRTRQTPWSRTHGTNPKTVDNRYI